MINDLFFGAWAGDRETIVDLRKKLLTRYLHENNDEFDGRELRGMCIEQMEIDVLQYRLMHRGYESFSPNFGGIDSPNADRVDGQSKFWDSGYRHLAIKLYANRVFLPKLPQ